MTAYLSALEAAKHANVSARTIRRWLRSGRLTASRSGHTLAIPLEQLEALMQQTGQADRFEAVEQDSGQGQEADVSASTAQPSPLAAESGQATLIALVAEQATTISTLIAKAEAAAMWQARAELLAGELAASREQVRALQAPREELEPSDTMSEGLPVDQVEPLARRWWQRLIWGS